MKAIVLFLVGLEWLVGLVTGAILYHYVLLPRTIDLRAQHLGMMRYSHAAGGMIPTDDMKWTLYYLKHGTME